VETRNLLFHTHPDQLWGLLSLLYNGYCGSTHWDKADLYHYYPLCLHGMLFADLYPFNPYSSRSDTPGIKMLIVKSRLNNQQKMDCEGNPPLDFQGTEETSEQINNETVEMRWQRKFGMEDTSSLTQLI